MAATVACPHCGRRLHPLGVGPHAARCPERFPLECDCVEPDPNVIHEWRRCHRPHYPPGYVEDLLARHVETPPTREWKPPGRRPSSRAKSTR